MFPNPYSHRGELQPYQQTASDPALRSKPSQDYSNHNPHSHPLERQLLLPPLQPQSYLGTHQGIRQRESQPFLANANILPGAYSGCLDTQRHIQQQQYAAMPGISTYSYQGIMPLQQDGHVNYQLDPYQQFAYMNMPMDTRFQVQQGYMPSRQTMSSAEAVSYGDRPDVRTRAMARQRGGYPPLEALNVDTRQVNTIPNVTLDTQDDKNAIDRQEERPQALTTEEMNVNMSCKVCMEQRADTFFEPCMHLAVCGWCSDVWRAQARRSRRTDPELRQPWKCPVCLKAVRQVKRVYY